MIPLIRKNLILSSDLSIILSLLSVLIFFYFIIDNSLAIMPDLATFIILQAFLHSDVDTQNNKNSTFYNLPISRDTFVNAQMIYDLISIGISIVTGLVFALGMSFVGYDYKLYYLFVPIFFNFIFAGIFNFACTFSPKTASIITTLAFVIMIQAVFNKFLRPEEGFNLDVSIFGILAILLFILSKFIMIDLLNSKEFWYVYHKKEPWA